MIMPGGIFLCNFKIERLKIACLETFDKYLSLNIHPLFNKVRI
jgi:hypothetical protein